MVSLKKRILTGALLCGAAISMTAQYAQSAAGDVPAYHDGPPKPTEKLPALMTPEQVPLAPGAVKYWGTQKNAYRVAAKVHKALYQQPCYCYCDRGHGHTSLRSCFESAHGSNCAVCMREAFYTYQQTQKGKKPAEIRAGIIRGEWQEISLDTAADIK
jgi:uncharacterized protein with PCYCGC motif